MLSAFPGVRFVLLDIEGTITDIHFVHQVLFPYAAAELEAYVLSHQMEDKIIQCLKDVQQTVLAEEGVQLNQAEAIAQLLRWIAEDRKHPALKRLQGWIWRVGYETGAYQGHLYPEVLPVLRQLQAHGIQLGIYSSGSVEAQHLLLEHSVFGDVRALFTALFDTGVGGKREKTSYSNIAHAVQCAPKEIVFLSDVLEELTAAQASGFQVLQICRDGLPPNTMPLNIPHSLSLEMLLN